MIFLFSLQRAKRPRQLCGYARQISPRFSWRITGHRNWCKDIERPQAYTEQQTKKKYVHHCNIIRGPSEAVGPELNNDCRAASIFAVFWLVERFKQPFVLIVDATLLEIRRFRMGCNRLLEISGQILTSIIGMLLAVIFHLRKNDLWFNIALHGFIDTVGLVYMYYGWL